MIKFDQTLIKFVEMSSNLDLFNPKMFNGKAFRNHINNLGTTGKVLFGKQWNEVQKLADTIAKYQINLNRNLEYFIQVNIGNEIQKSGIPVSELEGFYNYCVNEINLNIIGLMVIPPNDNNTEKYFKSMNELNKSLALENLSMGMSADYTTALKYGSNFVRIGSSIFGPRS